MHDVTSGTIIKFQSMAQEEKASETRPIESSEDEDEPENDLSCGSSSFEDEDERNETENADSDEIEEVVAAVAGINPYQLEPYASDSETSENEEVENPEENRLEDNSWCSWGNFEVMTTARECICCNEVQRVLDVKNEEDISCITQHPGFLPVCLNVHVLGVANFQYRQEYGDTPEQANE
ncbi:unnamed protein product [Mytilus coruscus]|uniref:Uncharacterized protein n=1 Tax=Mytilus coruscus TaxID=42192 RepID=A0A6J8EU20_MYTCO|nr:unnamed protein product [Mytilus coruscus]